MHIISIANQKGGCGKTTTAINLASTLAINGARVLLIDLDPQAHATSGLNIEPDASMYNVISKLTPRRVGFDDIIVRVADSFDLAPSNILVGTLEQELADEIGRELKLIEALEPVRERYDCILIDCPPSLGFLTINALRASSHVIIPVEASRFSLCGVEHIMDIVSLIKERLHHELCCTILMTMFDSRLQHSFEVLGAVKEKYAGILLNTIIHGNVKLRESAFRGRPVAQYDKYSRGFKDYFSLARELLQQWALEDPFFGVLSAPQAKNRRFEPEAFRETAFTLNAPSAQSVYVTGTFNGWSIDEAFRMRRGDDGQWALRLPLQSGSYRYRFVIDGRWREDPGNALKEENPFGEINSVVDVS